MLYFTDVKDMEKRLSPFRKALSDKEFFTFLQYMNELYPKGISEKDFYARLPDLKTVLKIKRIIEEA